VVASLADQRTWRSRPLPFVTPTATVSPVEIAALCVPSVHVVAAAATVQVTAVATPFT
jgi:hypothetical protein